MLCIHLNSSFTKFDSGILDLDVFQTLCKYSNFCFVYYLHILDSSGCPGEKDRNLENQKYYLDPALNKVFDFLNVRPFSSNGFFTFLVVVGHGVALQFYLC